MNRKAEKNVPLAGLRCIDDAFPILVDGHSCGPGSGGASRGGRGGSGQGGSGRGASGPVVVVVVVVERSTLNHK